jgi:hypothetical protein
LPFFVSFEAYFFELFDLRIWLYRPHPRRKRQRLDALHKLPSAPPKFTGVFGIEFDVFDTRLIRTFDDAEDTFFRLRNRHLPMHLRDVALHDPIERLSSAYVLAFDRAF